MVESAGQSKTPPCREAQGEVARGSSNDGDVPRVQLRVGEDWSKGRTVKGGDVEERDGKSRDRSGDVRPKEKSGEMALEAGDQEGGQEGQKS